MTARVDFIHFPTSRLDGTHDASGEMFKIRDTEFGFTRWVSANNITFEDVPIGRIPTDIFSDNFL